MLHVLHQSNDYRQDPMCSGFMQIMYHTKGKWGGEWMNNTGRQRIEKLL